MAPEVERARQADRQIGIDLNQAVIAALIIIIAAPAFARDEFEAEAFAIGHRNMRHAAPTAARDRGVEGLLQPILGDGEGVKIGLYAVCQGAIAGDERLDPGEFGVVAGEWFQPRPYPEQPFGFVGEGEARALHHLQSRFGGAQLGAQEVGAAAFERVRCAPRRKINLRHQLARRREQGRLVARRRLRGLLQFGWPIISVDIAGLVRPDFQRQPQIGCGDVVERLARRRGAAHVDGGDARFARRAFGLARRAASQGSDQ